MTEKSGRRAVSLTSDALWEWTTVSQREKVETRPDKRYHYDQNENHSRRPVAWRLKQIPYRRETECRCDQPENIFHNISQNRRIVRAAYDPQRYPPSRALTN